MTKIVVDIPEEIYKKIDLKKVQEGLARKETVVNNILRIYFEFFESNQQGLMMEEKDKKIEKLMNFVKTKDKKIEDLINDLNDKYKEIRELKKYNEELLRKGGDYKSLEAEA